MIDYILFRIWHFYAHLDRYGKKSDMSSKGKKKKEKPWEKELRRRGYVYEVDGKYLKVLVDGEGEILTAFPSNYMT